MIVSVKVMATRDNAQKSIPLHLNTVPKNLNAKHCIIVMSGKGGCRKVDSKGTLPLHLDSALSGLFDTGLS